MHVMKAVFEVHKPGFRRIGNRLSRGARLRCSGLVTWERVAVNQGMSRCAPLNLAEADQITPFEVAISVFELPERRVRGASMEDVAHCRIGLADAPLSQFDLLGPRTFVKPVHIQLTDKG
jgi:hypothetical protein